MKRILWGAAVGFCLAGCSTTYEFPGKSDAEANQIVAQCHEEAAKNANGEAIKDEVLDRCYTAHGARAKQPF